MQSRGNGVTREESKRQINMNEWKDRRKTHTKRKTSSKKTTTEDTTELHHTITRFLCRKQSTTHPHGNNSRPQKNPHQRPPPKPPPGTQGTQTTTTRVTPWTDIAVIAHPTGHNQLKTNPRSKTPSQTPTHRSSLLGKMRKGQSNKNEPSREDAPGPRTNALSTLNSARLHQLESHNSHHYCQSPQNLHPQQVKQRNNAPMPRPKTTPSTQKKQCQMNGKLKSPSEEC